MYIQEVPKKFQEKQPDIILRINNYERKNGKYVVIPVDLYTYNQSIDLLSEAIIKAFLNLNDFRSIFESLNKNAQEELKRQFQKQILSEIYISKVNEGCWELLLYFGMGLVGLSLYFKSAINNTLATILKPWAEKQGKKIVKPKLDLKEKPTILNTEFLKEIQRIVDKNPNMEINVNCKININDRGNDNLELRVFKEKEKIELPYRNFDAYDKYLNEIFRSDEGA